MIDVLRRVISVPPGKVTGWAWAGGERRGIRNNANT